jgi:sorbose reductase
MWSFAEQMGSPTDLTTLQYNASKAGLLHLARSLAIEWLGICRVNCISPGYIITEMIETIPEEIQKRWIDLTPSKRMGSPHELKGVSVSIVDFMRV